jgi:hypothetical protein
MESRGSDMCHSFLADFWGISPVDGGLAREEGPWTKSYHRGVSVDDTGAWPHASHAIQSQELGQMC